MSIEEQKKINKQHSTHPKSGDLWTEFLSPIYFVSEVTDDKVTVLYIKEKKFKTLSKEEFYNLVHYQTRDECWCNVIVPKKEDEYEGAK